ncbi:recombinase [Pseudomonas phage PspYZU05]|uniref:RecA-like recombination protein n=1 Tax=Pseudomonas phage PspYZU05 TaxID=1983556 RepID=A0A2U7NBR0_9CAUD|nr:recombinase [Pseudomonas phage PspYZU05]ASD52019.1 RecA-like recombination protein [Pseudomonas phage PspYZU05]
MKIKSVKSVGKKEVYDLSVDQVEHYVLENGIVTHNTGVMYSADTVFIIGKRQIKEGTELEGFQFVLNAEKSRTVKEKSKFFIDVKFSGGIDPYSGLLDMALELGFVVKPKNGWYSRAFLNDETGELEAEEKVWRAKATSCTEFWSDIFKHEAFREAIKTKYQLGAIDSNPEVDAEVDSLISSKCVKNSDRVKPANLSGHFDVDDIDDIDVDNI